jgi:hypothetical protein
MSKALRENASAEAGIAAGASRSSLKTRLEVSAFVGLAIIVAWLYYTVNEVLTLYEVTRDIQQTTDLVLCRMREDPELKEIPVVVVTAKELTEVDYEALRGSAQRVVRKGADPSRLVAEILRAIREEKTA